MIDVKNKKKIIIQIISVVILLLFVVGISYAAFTFLGGSTDNNVIGTGQISMSYQEPTSIVELNNTLPTTDVEGKVQNIYFEFTVTSYVKTNTTDNNGVDLPYEINISSQVIDSEYEQLGDEYVKIYLTKVENSNETEVIEPTLISELNPSTIVETNNLIYETSNLFNNGRSQVVEVYRLRTWLDETFDSTQSIQYEYRFRVNVNSGSVDASPCFSYTETATEVTITDYKCFEGNSYGLETITDVVIPSKIKGKSVVKIADTTDTEKKSFYQKGITSVILPKTLKIIGLRSFEFNELTNIIIPNSVTYIDGAAFSSNQLTNVTIPDSVTYLGDWAFAYNQLINITIGNAVTNIGEYALAYNKLSIVSIPNNVTTIGLRAFFKTSNSNPSLTNVINNTERLFNWGLIINGTTGYNFVTGAITHSLGNVFVAFTPASCFEYTENTTEVTITDYKCYAGNSYGLSTITNVVIPSEINGKNVVKIADTTDTEKKSFYQKGITSVALPNTLKRLGIRSFQMNQLTSIMIPNSITSIGDAAFSYNQLANVVIPDSVTYIGYWSFSWNQLAGVTISNSTASIEEYAFAYNSLINVIIPDSVTKIGSNAFLKASNSNRALTKIINETGRSFDWGLIVNGTTGYNWPTGTVVNGLGNVSVTSS